MLENYGIKFGYSAREKVIQYSLLPNQNVTHQPHVYEFAGYLAERFGCDYIIDLGCGQAKKLATLHPKFNIIGVDLQEHIQYCKATYSFGNWLIWNFDEPNQQIPIEIDILQRSLVVCADVIEHLLHPEYLLEGFSYLLKHVAAAVLSTPDRDLVHGYEHMGPPKNPAHIREWNLRELCTFVKSFGIPVEFSGYTYNNDVDWLKNTSLLVLANHQKSHKSTPPDDFRVVAITTAYNEEDIIASSLRHMIEQGIEVYVIDNWSTDTTAEIARGYIGRGVINVELFPETDPQSYQRMNLLQRVEELCLSLQADWYILYDIDEIRNSPWHDVSLREAIYHVDQCGFNCIDHTVLTFRPVDDFMTDQGLEQMKFYELGRNPGFFVQLKAWKNVGKSVQLHPSLGHNISFDGRQIYPYKFLLRHYPIRSQKHGEQKVFIERKPRRDAEAVKKGFHNHYDHITPQYDFLYNRFDLEIFEVKHFSQKYLIERLSGVGITPYPKPFPTKPRPFDWLEEHKQKPVLENNEEVILELAVAHNRITELEEQLEKIHKTKGWRFLNYWWRFKRRFTFMNYK